MTTQSPNDDLLIDVLAQIERTPERWNQRVWVHRTDCGTSYCFAGWACALTAPDVTQPDFLWSAATLHAQFAGQTGRTSRGLVPTVAADVLGLTPAQADELFELDNTLDDLYDVVSSLTGLDPDVLRDKVYDRV